MWDTIPPQVSKFPMKDICKCLFMQEDIHNLKSCIAGIITHVGPQTAIWKVYTDWLQNGTD